MWLVWVRNSSLMWISHSKPNISWFVYWWCSHRPMWFCFITWSNTLFQIDFWDSDQKFSKHTNFFAAEDIVFHNFYCRLPYQTFELCIFQDIIFYCRLRNFILSLLFGRLYLFVLQSIKKSIRPLHLWNQKLNFPNHHLGF